MFFFIDFCAYYFKNNFKSMHWKVIFGGLDECLQKVASAVTLFYFEKNFQM